MNFLSRANKRYVYCGNNAGSMLAELSKNRDGQLIFHKIATEDGPPTDPEVLKRLILHISPSSAGEVSMVFSLRMFEVLNLTLPLLPDQAIERTLPYHIAKAINKPLSEYYYDWQVTHRMKDQMQVSIYLFATAKFDALQKIFRSSRLEITFFEADAFAAFAYLNSAGIMKHQEPTLCVLLWPQSITLGICENGRVRMARSIALLRPEDDGQENAKENIPIPPSRPRQEGSTVEIVKPSLDEDALELEIVAESTEEDIDTIDFDIEENSVSILSGFDLISPENDGGAGAVPEKQTIEEEKTEEETKALFDLTDTLEPPPRTSMEEYFESISIEIMRTRDYFSTVIKGKPITSYHILGAENAFDQLHDRIKESIGEEAKEIKVEPENSCSTGLYVIGLGAATRW